MNAGFPKEWKTPRDLTLDNVIGKIAKESQQGIHLIISAEQWPLFHRLSLKVWKKHCKTTIG